MNSFELRDYQADGVAGIRDCFRRRVRRPLYVLATGGGKSVLSTYMARAAIERGTRVLFQAHSEELTSNLKKSLTGWNIPHGLIEPGERETNQLITVGRTKTIANRIRKNLALIERTGDLAMRAVLEQKYIYDLVITDEAHHAAPGNLWWYVMEYNADAYHVGLTATPARLDGKPLGRQHGGWWDELVPGPGVMDLIEHPDGPFLCPPVVFQADRAKLPDFSQIGKRGGDFKTNQLSELMSGGGRYVYGDAVGEYRKHCDGAPGIAFCVDIKNAEACAQQFRDGGYQSTVLVADTPNRPQVLRDLAAGRIHMVASVGALTEGVDVPEAVCGIFLRKTASLVLARQMAGRLMRISPGKNRAVILDLVGNTFEENHGLPTADIEWSLDHKPKKKKSRAADDPEEQAGRQCASCYAWNPPRSVRCLECGAEFKPAQAQQIDFIEGELQEVDAVAVERARRAMRKELEPRIKAATSLKELSDIAQQLGYKKGWAYMTWTAKRNKRLKYGT